MFALTDAMAAMLVKVNLRAEHHGNEVQPAVDLKLALKVPNDMLGMFDPALKTALYTRGVPPVQPQLEGIAAVSDAPKLRFPELVMPLHWATVGEGYRIVLDGAGAGKVALDNVRVGDFALTALEGGTVLLTLRVQTGDEIRPAEVAALAALVERDVMLRIVPAEVELPIPV